MSATNLTRDEAMARARLISEPRYEIALDLNRGEEIFGVDAVIRFRCSEPGAATFVEFIAATVHEIVLNGKPLDIGRAFDGKRIRIDGMAGENELHVVADGGYQRNGIGMHRATDPV